MSRRSAVARLAASPREALWLLRYMILLTVLPALIRVLPLPVLLDWLTPSNSWASLRPGKAPGADRIVAITDGLLGHPHGHGHRSCLKRSLALYHELRRVGLPVELCLGVKRSTPGNTVRAPDAVLQGHAWLARGSEVIYERSSNALSAYAETYRYPPRDVEPRRAEVS